MDRRAALPQLPPDDQLGDESNLPSLRQLFPEHLRMEAANAYYQQQQSQQSAARQGVYPPLQQLTPQQQHQLNIQQQLHGVQPLPPQYQTYQHYATAPSAQPVQGSSQGVIHPPPQGRELDSKYDCPYCGKRFDRPSSVKIHITSHTGEKPYVCVFPGCGRRFSVNSNMRRHLRTHTPNLQSSSSSHDVGDGDDDEATSPRSPPQSQPRPSRSAPTIPPIVQGQSRPAAPTPPPPSIAYSQYTLHQQQIMNSQVPLRPHSQSLAPHGAVMPPQPQHHATPGLQMPQYSGYAYASYPSFSQSQQHETTEPTRWLPSSGMPSSEQDYMPR